MAMVPALQRTVYDLVAEYEEKRDAIEGEIAALYAAVQRLEMAASIQGTYVGRIVDRPFVHAESLRKLLLQSGWKALYQRLQINRLATAKDKALFEKTIADPPPFTAENARATFGRYFENPRFHVLRGLAEAFCALDRSYRSHSRVRIGVKGLPRRVILQHWAGLSSTWGKERFTDMVNALAVYQGKPLFEYAEMRAINAAHDAGEDAVLDGRSYTTGPAYSPEVLATVDRGMRVRAFANGNAHVYFDPATLLDINRALAEFYGDVLPDVDEPGAARAPSTNVAADLQFYWSPAHVVAAALDLAGVGEASRWSGAAPVLRVLEPSCGDGRILDGIRQRGHRGLGIECHSGRADQARAKGHAVITANFLDFPPEPEFDAVVMNPPFYGRHYAKHVRHALRFLRPGGVLVAIIPATAHYDHREFAGTSYDWHDLPCASFAEAGTNVPTGMMVMRAAR